MSQHLVTLLLGSNLGDREKNIETALKRIESSVGEIIEKTEILYTAPVEFVSNNIFCNIALLLKTQFSPIHILNSIKKIEYDMGRTKDTLISNSYSDRSIDIDIVLFGGVHFVSERLQIPHFKHLYNREFSRKLLDQLTKH
ncbi:2-amino-4-hydroxy-6-hydroxymethyldihydropteridine diphosphokinase [Candidatus Kaistella beijingensis]|uniref:2-amino-4-hydroxy-6- hydroxymethyldihydropteridine diphosphokinase n=1 Tax=Candidatus Kaistella beijingensis TaxID=2820270 RepID=UPI001CC640DE|nr:2-amino-4-hydroxy-6-hydroxymethyldihydropteridine diphosphokinase [Candidatus Kaistella beijingensis]UBB89477.1 2-amino-4-hydroxy-6-hydroxymethyldihydropteridine diphosphokinase [Candidatus Kaistella beijingensis]